MKYAEVILPLPLDNTYTYFIPPEMEESVQPNLRVVVPFGKKRYYTAIVKAVYDEIPATEYALKEIHATIDDTPLLRHPQTAFWEWMASYYLCKVGDVYKAAVPAGLTLESETVVHCRDAGATTSPARREQLILDAFADKSSLTVAALEKITGTVHLLPALNRLVRQGIVTVSETLKKGFTPKTETYVRLSSAFGREEDLSAVFPQLGRAGQQAKLLLAYLEQAEPFPAAATPAKEIGKKQLLASTGAGAATLDSLVRRGWMEYYEKAVSRLPSAPAPQPPHRLTPPQQTAFQRIKNVFETKQVCLLHGIPSCGKTEIYLHLASEMLAQGRQVLYLLPEIALTTQIAGRLRSALGDKLRVYHSGFPDAERVEIWHELAARPSPLVILGVRSALFLPFAKLGLVIVDEEHEASYKQQDPAPRYHARSAAVMLAHLHGAKTLLGSATPSLDSIYNTKTGKYGLVTLSARYGDAPPPQIHLVDTKELKRKKIMKQHDLLSPFLHRQIDEALERDEQVILFRNRRGFAPVMECKSCGRAIRCTRCDVSLTYHRQQNRLVCHYCGHAVPLPQRCPACGHAEMKWTGFGTEKIEEEITALYPGVRTVRLDLDTARTRRDGERILADFEQGRSRILVGTQMVARGMDFERVTLVGILNADSLMNYPDFRAHERAFQLMTQVAGRAGRRGRQGIVVIQTAQPDHPLLQMLHHANYDAMVASQLHERYLFGYPPYLRLITVILRSRDEAALDDGAAFCARLLQERLGDDCVHGPFAPPVNRIQTRCARHIVLKIKRAQPTADVRASLENVLAQMHRHHTCRLLNVYCDVDG
ncbi:MAG: primosomal protein N' [Tannerella sp.]|jgi:primosomal protein N' (replication factor Y)|nr:primosomal protein N' [Tannerella sp.]